MYIYIDTMYIYDCFFVQDTRVLNTKNIQQSYLLYIYIRFVYVCMYICMTYKEVQHTDLDLPTVRDFR